MSGEASSLVWDHSKTRGSQKLALLALARRCRRRTKPFFATVSAPELASMLNLKERQARDLIAGLLKSGELIVHHAGSGRGVANMYHIVTPRAEKDAPECMAMDNPNREGAKARQPRAKTDKKRAQPERSYTDSDGKAVKHAPARRVSHAV